MSTYHPSLNDLAERYVQTTKEALKKMTDSAIESRVARFLSYYRIAPQYMYNKNVSCRVDVWKEIKNSF